MWFKSVFKYHLRGDLGKTKERIEIDVISLEEKVNQQSKRKKVT